MLHWIHVVVRMVGIVVVLLAVVLGVAFYFSEEYDALCNGQKSLERGRAGEPYHCFG